MNALQPQIDTLEAAIIQLGEGDHRILEQLPAMLGDLRTGAAILERRQEELVSLYEVGQETVSVVSLDELLESILDRALVLVGAERGFLVLCEPGQDSFAVPVARQFAQGEVDSTPTEISRGLIRRVLASCQPVVTTNAQEDARFQLNQYLKKWEILMLRLLQLDILRRN